ncbi:DUF4173 domain-containing protein [Rhodobacteraceae bacterium B1Z28]|uniref:DUF4173 domain-containing protein n=1 Tax=Ruegeria haliotis TaxID=2747601 RepID=A0ABX2PRE7_9RHOB|nr:DUF4173 domain-containing protein [Ruegeria haliotis]NVO55772.1 DUF4173 domain-containing protein [Ruegeria haliotis]
MSGQLVINGVPDSIRHDGWWLACSDAQAGHSFEASGPSNPSRPDIRHRAVLPVLLLLVWLADWLFWDHGPGISIALFVLTLSACVLAVKPKGATRREWGIALGVQVICNLPIVEQVQALSLLFTVGGITMLVVWVGYDRMVEWWQAIWALIHLSSVGVVLLPVTVVKETRTFQASPDLKQHARSMILPLTVGLVFLFLLAAANPILERFLAQFSELDFLTAEHLQRVVFWFGMACLIWPYLNLSGGVLGPLAKAPSFRSGHVPWLAALVTSESLRNSLLLFNLLFFVQTVLDIGVLTGGMSLPEGMTYARYAHRGAYPLVATALLAGLFAIATHRMIDQSRFLRNLMLVWLAQNMFLVITAVIRLSLYVEAYTLTYLRVAAFIWMGLVFVGLILIIVQIIRTKSIAWLVRSNLAALAVTLFLCCFVNFAFVVADFNFRKSYDLSNLDTGYICGLGEQALPVIDAYEAKTGHPMCLGDGWYMPVKPVFQPLENWREWGFRRWRLQVYLDGGAQE